MSQSNVTQVSRIIADYVTGFDLAVVPEPVVTRARESFIDTIGVMLAGSHEDVFHLVCDIVRADATQPAASIVQQSLRASSQMAAFANGVAAHAMDYDFTFITGQAISPVIPAILSLAEVTRATPAEILSAFIIGAEVGGRCVRANPNASLQGGWHMTSIVGVIGAAAAAARLLKVPADCIQHVIGISTSVASGISTNYGTMTKPLHAGNAARNGILAAELGARGFTASPRALEDNPAGYFAIFGRGLDVTLKPFDDFGSRYDLVSSRLSIKSYPCGGLTHTLIEAALDLRQRIGTRIGEIEAIHCAVSRHAGQRAGTDYPATVEAAKFSVAYLAAYSLVHGAPRIAAFTAQALADDRLKALAKTVTACVDPELGAGISGSPARIRITMKTGEVFDACRYDATGSADHPMSRAQLEEKFFDCAALVTSVDAAQKILAIVDDLPDRGSFDDFWPLFRKASDKKRGV